MFQGSLEEAAPIFDRFWPEARAVSDPTLDLYRAFGLRRGNPAEMFHPGLWIRGLRAFRKGYRQTAPVGDPWMRPGAFLIENGRVIRRGSAAHSGDLPDFQSFVT